MNKIKKNKALQINTSNNQLTYLTFNVDMAVEDNKVEGTKWIQREERIIKTLVEQNATIVSLQELRELDENKVETFLAKFALFDYKIIYASRNPGPLAFGNAILYKANTVFPLQTEVKWLSSTPDVPSDDWFFEAMGKDGFGNIVLGVKFCMVEENKVDLNRTFWVFNTHLALNEDSKDKSIAFLKQYIPLTAKGQPWILSGDFNFFPDMRGPAQLASFLETGALDVVGLKTESGRSLAGTFVGYERDRAKAVDSTNPTTALDHIFIKNGSYEEVTTSTKTYLDPEPAELTERNKLVSDHLLIKTKITLFF